MVAVAVGGCGGDEDDGAAASTDDDSVTNECGTYDPDEDTHGVRPNDPASEPIVSACTDLCAKMATIDSCTFEATSCIDACRMRACHICPGTLEPLTRCRSEQFDASGCTCAGGEPSCDLPAECEDEESKTGMCGG